MSFFYSIVRTLAMVSVVALAACQTTPSSDTTADATTGAATETSASTATDEVAQPGALSGADEPASQEAMADGAPVAIFIADMKEQSGWHPIQIDTGNLYVNPQPVVTREDLTGVQAGSNDDGEGLLALVLHPTARERVVQATTQNPDMRLALIVGRTLLSAPGYSGPVDTEYLIFGVGTEENAMAVARAIAGVSDENGAGAASAGGAGTGVGPAGAGATGTPAPGPAAPGSTSSGSLGGPAGNMTQ